MTLKRVTLIQFHVVVVGTHVSRFCVKACRNLWVVVFNFDTRTL